MSGKTQLCLISLCLLMVGTASADTVTLYPLSWADLSRQVTTGSTFDGLVDGVGTTNNSLTTGTVGLYSGYLNPAQNFTIVYRHGLIFNTTTIPSYATVTGIDLILYRTNLVTGLGTTKLEVVNFYPDSYSTANTIGNYINFGNDSVGQFNTWTTGNNTANITDFSIINKGGYTGIGLKTEWDQNKTYNGTFANNTNTRFAFGSNSATDTGTRPYITVTYTLPITASFTPINSVVATGKTISFTDTSIYSPIAWNWTLRDISGNDTEVSFSDSQNPTYTFAQEGNYSIRLNATNIYGSNTTPSYQYWVNVTNAYLSTKYNALLAGSPAAIYRSATSDTWSGMVEGTGTGTNAGGDVLSVYYRTATSSNRWQYIKRLGLTLDTSFIQDTSIVTSAKLILHFYSSTNSTYLQNDGLVVTNFTPDDPLSFTGSDYDQKTDNILGSYKLNEYPAIYTETIGSVIEIPISPDYVKLNDYTSLMVRGTNDTLGVEPFLSTWEPSAASYVIIYGNATSPIKRPYLEVSCDVLETQPSADFVANTVTGIAPHIVSFTDKSLGGIIYWNWSFGDGTYSEDQNPIHQYMSPGTYTVALNATNDVGTNIETKTDYIVTSSLPAIAHPVLFNVKQSPGYLNSGVEPWSTAYALILSSANTGLTLNFTAPTYRESYVSADYAADMALVYQVTGDTRYANKTVESLLNCWNDWNVTLSRAGSPNRDRAMQDYLIAYDFIAQTKNVNSTLDSENDTQIRANLAIGVDQTYSDATYITNSYNSHWMTALYTGIGMGAEVLRDYGNSSLQTISVDGSKPLWENMGYSELFENDTIHTWKNAHVPNNGLFGYDSNDVDSRDYTGSYKDYYAGDLFRWAQVYYNVYGENLYSTFPKLKSFATEQVYSTLPNHYQSNIVAEGQQKDDTHMLAYQFLDETNRSYIAWHTHIQSISTTLPRPTIEYNWRTYEANDVYLILGDYASETGSPPPTTNSIDKNISYQVIREDWTTASDWLQFVTWNVYNTIGFRAQEHGDQLAFEYYSKGDLLMPDGGEVRYTDQGDNTNRYGYDAVFHNGLLIDNGYPRGLTSNVTGRGMYKGNQHQIVPVTNGTVQQIIDNSNITLIQANATINNVWNKTNGISSLAGGGEFSISSNGLSAPIEYTREIVYPFKDYMIVIDRASSSITNGYTNEFRFGSLMVNESHYVSPNKMTNSNLGNVNGSLSINGVSYDWANDTVFVERDPGLSTNSIDWATTNPYGDSVRLKLFTSPSTPFTYQKFPSRIAGYGTYNEVTVPNVYLKQSANNTLYRITALLSRYENETPRTPTELPVSGVGSAIKVVNGAISDYIYTGTGTSTFEGFTTDADTAFIRSNTTSTYVLMINGSFIDYYTESEINLGSKQAYYEYSGAFTLTPKSHFNMSVSGGL